jgi:hypothetical protein
MSSIGAAPCAASLSPARAAASRRNGAKSRGPKSPEGKARSAQNALRHGLRAQKCVVMPGERASAFAAFEGALLEELAPQGALQMVLAQRVVAASWRLARSERLEAELFAEGLVAGGGLGRALIRDGNGARAFDTLLRYRGSTLAELWRALRTLKALQAEQAARAGATPAELPTAEPTAPEARRLPEPRGMPIEPETSTKPRACAGPADPAVPGSSKPLPAPAWPPHWPLPATAPSAPGAKPSEPETRRKPTESATPAIATMTVARGPSPASLLAGTALVPPGRRRG